MECPITLTQKAIEKLKEFIASSPESPYVRLGVKGGGCVGFEWVIDLNISSQIKERDHVFHVSDVLVVIDPVSCNYLKNTTIDWKEGKMSAGFAFSNPGAKTCGCGNSFSL